MNIVFDVLKELNYFPVDEFIVEHKINNKSVKKLTVNVQISKENDSQVILAIKCDNKLLRHVAEGDLVKEIALQFRKKEYHRAEMDRNTALLLICKHDEDEQIDVSSKVKIEDDPYYFKKYVLSYDEVGVKEAELWIKENNYENNLVALIQEYIADTERFARYKTNSVKESIYSYFMELVIKIHCFPIRTVETKGINSINYYLNKEIDKIKSRKKEPVDINQIKIEEFLNSSIDCSDKKAVCDSWNKILKLEREGKL